MIEKHKNNLSSLILVLAGLFGALVSLYDLFVDISTLLQKDRVSIILLLLSLLTLGIGLERLLNFKIISSKIQEINDKHETSKDLLEKILSYMVNKKVDEIPEFIKDLPSGLKMIAEEKIKPLMYSLTEIVKDRKSTLEIGDKDLFKIYFKNTLNENPKATFLATSLPTKDYFWDDKNFLNHMKKFIKKGGTIKRIFILSDIKDLEDCEVIDVLKMHADASVKVHTIVRNEFLKSDYNHPFFIKEDCEIGWHATLSDGNIQTIEVTANEKILGNYNTTFYKMIDKYHAKSFN